MAGLNDLISLNPGGNTGMNSGGGLQDVAMRYLLSQQGNQQAGGDSPIIGHGRGGAPIFNLSNRGMQGTNNMLNNVGRIFAMVKQQKQRKEFKDNVDTIMGSNATGEDKVNSLIKLKPMYPELWKEIDGDSIVKLFEDRYKIKVEAEYKKNKPASKATENQIVSLAVKLAQNEGGGFASQKDIEKKIPVAREMLSGGKSFPDSPQTGYTDSQEGLILENMKAYGKTREEIIKALTAKGLL